MKILLIALASLVTVHAAPSMADACSFSPAVLHEIVANDADSTPPILLDNLSYEVNDFEENGCAESSCTGLSVTIRLEASDDISSPSSIGFEIESVSGNTLVRSNRPVERAFVNSGDGTMRVILRGESKDYSGVIRIIPIDEAGNRGDAVSLDIEIGGGIGCLASSKRSGLIGYCLILLALAIASRRRRGRSEL